MDKEFARAFKQLNDEQRQAVTQIDGPVLVIAGPGTGKTQLTSTRVGYILQQADVEPAEILCLTYTDNGVLALRERLEILVPQAAHKVRIATYHSFGTDLIRNNAEYFPDLQGEALDDLAIATIINSLIDKLPYTNPLKNSLYARIDLVDFINDAKQALLSPEQIAQVANDNLAALKSLQKLWAPELEKLTAFRAISKASLPVFAALLAKLDDASTKTTKLPKAIRPLQDYAREDLLSALQAFSQSGKTPALTAWKNRWLEKDNLGNFVPAGKKSAETLLSAANLYREYQAQLVTDKAFDYDDMILRAIQVLEAQPDFKYTLAEKYQYIMLDEFQDTNPAQMRLIELLTDHPVHEGRPNILAVGDDDQAIFAFQGADHTNMTHFAQHYRDVKLINLRQNYRSHQDIIELASNIVSQISQRLEQSFPGLEKILVAAASVEAPDIVGREFITDTAQYSWVAAEIAKLIKAGIAPKEIAVLAPQHKHLVALLPFLSKQKIPMSYEKREDILEDEKILMLERMSRLILALAQDHQAQADYLWGEVASYDFWGLSTEEIWQLKNQAKKTKRSWTDTLLDDPKTHDMTVFILRLKDLLPLASLEEQLDALIGIDDIHKELGLPMRSPFFEYYFGQKAKLASPESFIDLLSGLSLLRTKLRARQRRQSTTTHLDELIRFIDDSRAANLNVLNTSPYHESQNAVNLLTPYGAKGREFEAVFILSAQNEVWGNASRSRSNALKLPANLEYIAYRGLSEDERLRLLYVAVTRARRLLYLTSYQRNLAGRYFRHLEFLGISRAQDNTLSSSILPSRYRLVSQDLSSALTPESAQSYWTSRHLPPHSSKLIDQLKPVLNSYSLNATDLNQFIDLENAGPTDFFIYNLLDFPQAPSARSAFGTAIHRTLSYVGSEITRTAKVPARPKVIKYFDTQLQGGWLRDDERQRLIARGHQALPPWLEQIGSKISKSTSFEYNFANEGVRVGEARLSGQVDRLTIDPKTRRIIVTDIKTGKALKKWDSTTKAHKFKQQLIFYKLLVEGSSTFRGYRVDRGVIEFAEPLDGQLVSLPLDFEEQAVTDLRKLIVSVWQHIQNLDMPDTSAYPKSIRGIRQFEGDLLK